MVYEKVIKEHIYLCKDGRYRVHLVFEDGSKKHMSYPKYIMEKHLDRYLTIDETIDHIDKNPLNNDLSNLRVLTRKEHCYNDVMRNHDFVVKCTFCGKEFTIKGKDAHNRNRKDRKQSGYFCSRSCSGKYGREIQLGLREHETKEKVIPIKYNLHK